MNCGRHYNDDKGCLMWSLFTAFYPQTWWPWRLYCTEMVQTFEFWLSGLVLLPRTDHSRWYNDDEGCLKRLSLITHSLTISGISWAPAPRSRSILRPGIDSDFSARGLPLGKYILRKIWIVSDNTATTKHAWRDRYLPHSICKLRRDEFFIQLRYWYLVIFTIFWLWYFSCGTEDQPTTILSLIPISRISIIPSLVL